MRKVTLCVLMLLVRVASAFEGTERVTSGVQPTKTSPDTMRTLDSIPSTTAARDPTATLEYRVPMFPSGGVTAPLATTTTPAWIINGVPSGIITAFVFGCILVWRCYCFWAQRRLAKRRLARRGVDRSSYSIGDSNFDLASISDLSEEDSLPNPGLSEADQREAAVKFRRAKPSGRPNDQEVSSLPGDVQELQS